MYIYIYKFLCIYQSLSIYLNIVLHIDLNLSMYAKVYLRYTFCRKTFLNANQAKLSKKKQILICLGTHTHTLTHGRHVFMDMVSLFGRPKTAFLSMDQSLGQLLFLQENLDPQNGHNSPKLKNSSWSQPLVWIHIAFPSRPYLYCLKDKLWSSPPSVDRTGRR